MVSRRMEVGIELAFTAGLQVEACLGDGLVQVRPFRRAANRGPGLVAAAGGKQAGEHGTGEAGGDEGFGRYIHGSYTRCIGC